MLNIFSDSIKARECPSGRTVGSSFLGIVTVCPSISVAHTLREPMRAVIIPLDEAMKLEKTFRVCMVNSPVG